MPLNTLEQYNIHLDGVMDCYDLMQKTVNDVCGGRR